MLFIEFFNKIKTTTEKIDETGFWGEKCLKINMKKEISKKSCCNI